MKIRFGGRFKLEGLKLFTWENLARLKIDCNFEDES
jgi:hypothetical protein